MAKKAAPAAAVEEAPAKATKGAAAAAAAAAGKKTTETINSKLQLVIKSGAFFFAVPPSSLPRRAPSGFARPFRPHARAHPPPPSPPNFRPPPLSFHPGKYCLGVKQTLKQLRAGKSELVLVSGNLPLLKRSEIEYYGLLAKTHVEIFKGSNVDLGTACGKLFRVSVMSIEDPGDSDIVKVLAPKKE